MGIRIERTDVWAAELEDTPGTLARKLNALADAGADLEFVVARRAPDKPGKGVVFATPVKGAAQCRAAKKAGFHKSKSLCAVRVEGPDKRGQGANVLRALAAKGINLRGISATATGRKFVAHIALDGAADATNAGRVLRAL